MTNESDGATRSRLSGTAYALAAGLCSVLDPGLAK